MRVDDRHLTGDQAVQSGKTLNPQEVERLNESRQKDSRPAAAADKVELSDLTGGLTRALDAARQQRVSRMEKLAEDYAAGRYQADVQAVSRALVAEMRAAGATYGPPKT
jgi:hypothetical protein